MLTKDDEDSCSKDDEDSCSKDGEDSCSKDDEQSLPQVATQRRSLAKDLGGLCRLGTDAVHKTTELVEAQHSRLDWFSGAFFKDRGADKARNPIAALVYESIYTVNYLVGNSLEFVVSNLEPLLGKTAPSQRKEAAIAILNGVVGDYLETQHNPLAIQMEWRTLEDTTTTNNNTEQQLTTSPKRILLLIHGSCNGPQDWWQEGHNHGIALSRELDYTPLFLHYNTGLHCSENGKLLSQAIQTLLEENGNDTSFTIVAHSMGGLISRSACYYATQDNLNHEWIQRLDHLITLGTPHHGAMLERGGKLVDAVLGAHRFTEPISWLGKIRSNGVMDLGYGNIRDEDWLLDSDHSGVVGDSRNPTSLPSGSVRTLAVAAVLGGANSSSNRMLGESMRMDGLVTEASAFGRGHSNEEMNLVFEEDATFYNMNHVELLSSPEVYKTMFCFLAS